MSCPLDFWLCCHSLFMFCWQIYDGRRFFLSITWPVNPSSPFNRGNHGATLVSSRAISGLNRNLTTGWSLFEIWELMFWITPKKALIITHVMLKQNTSRWSRHHWIVELKIYPSCEWYTELCTRSLGLAMLFIRNDDTELCRRTLSTWYQYKP